MKKVWIIVIITVILFGAFALYQNKSKVDNPKPINPANLEVKVETRLIKEDFKDQRLSIKFEYPEFKDVKNADVINKDIKTTADNLVSEFKKQTKDTDFSNLPKEFINAKIANYEIALQTDKVLSILIINSDMYAGAAHPNNYNTTLNYNLDSGVEIGITDLFKTGSSFLDDLSKLAIIDLQNQYKKGGLESTGEMIAEGASPKLENFSKFTLSHDSLNIIFDPYQVGPYAAGTRVVRIPYSEIGDKLDPEFKKLTEIN